ncbi:GATA transcription factor 4-like [Phalaenopsis equestris]|uniref:GATA transcription factor 4-like n=1 Tax=Phalaenopsis equestris TaxID=78828 RepID=UPI0009E28FB2|nr:GATA transcription factor 4-like [Phalaenopsis equestris]
MASRWETELGMGMGMPAAFSTVPAPAYIYGRLTAAETLPDFTQHDIYSSSSSSSSLVSADASLLTAAQFAVADINSNPECHYPHHASIADDIYIPTDEVAELEWLSKFVEDSFSDVPVQSLAMETVVANSIHRTGISAVARGARSKRSRGMISGAESGGVNHLPASAWSSLTPSSSTTSSSCSSDFPTPKICNRKKQGAADTEAVGGGMRRCTHCASDKTPQWRTGPLGPKSLCNACGVRFKSGRLVPEYRPAASPTFVLTQHSNSHRKVLELRRQRENAAIYNEYNVR